jgi:hypothetical protein
MGEAGNAAKGLLAQSRDRLLLRGYIGGWSADQVVPGKGSKNIPMLRFAHDMVEADRRVDLAMLNKGFNAMHGYMAVTKAQGQFMGEEYSTIYWRWIVLPAQIARGVAARHGRHTLVAQIDKWVHDFLTINALGAWPHYDFKVGAHGGPKKQGKHIFGIPTASIGFSRAWVMNKGDDGKRGLDDSLSWGDATSHASWFAWMLRKIENNQLRGGDDWVAKLVEGFSKQYALRDPATPVSLVNAVFGGVFPADDVAALEHGPTKPVVIGRTNLGTWGVGEECYNAGSTSFMHVKRYSALKKAYLVDSIATPLKRSNHDHGVAILAPDFSEVELIADDGTVWSWDQGREYRGTHRVMLPGVPEWVVRLTKNGASVLTEEDEPTVVGGEKEPWYKSLWRKILGWF